MPENHDNAKMPPIPDGGLSDSMPDWLRRPPAWRTLKDTDVVQTEPVHTAELPAPDTSVIDPRAFLTDDDLPLWLRNMGRTQRAGREHAGDDEAIPEVADDTGADSGREPATPLGEESNSAASTTTSGRFVPRTPRFVTSDQPGSPERDNRRASTPIGVRQPPTPRWWQGASMVLLLASLLLVAIVVIVILAVV